MPIIERFVLNIARPRSPLKIAAVAMTLLVTTVQTVSVVRAEAAEQSRATSEATLERHAATLKATMSTYCFSCHGTKKQSGEINLERAFDDLAKSNDITLWSNVIKMVKFGEMPPKRGEQLNESEKESLLSNANGVLLGLGADSLLDELNTDPHYANYVDHESLFNGKHKGPAFTPSRLWYKQSDYANRGTVNGPTLDNLLKFFNVRIAEQVDGVLVQGKLSSVDSKKMKDRDQKAKAIKQIKDEAKRNEALAKLPPKIEPPMVLSKFNKEYKAFAEASGKPGKAECEAILKPAFVEILRRPPLNEDELNKYTGLLLEKSQKIGRGQGLKMTLLAIHLKPEMYYRMELGMGKALPDGRRSLTPMEIYYALCHAMGVPPVADTGVKPRIRVKKDALPPLNQALLLAVYENKLNNGDDIRVILKDYIGNPQGQSSDRGGYFYDDVRSLLGPRQKIVDFIRGYFGYAEAEDNFKDNSPNRPVELIQDADRFVHHVLNNDRDVLKELLTANTFLFSNDKNIGFVSTSRNRFNEHRKHYGVDIKELRAGKLNSQVITSKPDSRGRTRETLLITFENHAGLLTHPVWGFTHSKNNETDPVIRGKWIREKLLAGTVREVPIQVDAKVSDDHSKTLRERFDVTKEKYCWSCHQKMNPLGMPFESYNELGQFRTSDAIAKKPIDASGSIDGTGEADIDGPVKNAVELAHRLAKSTRVRQSFVRHAFRFWMGRNEMPSDSPTLMAADKAYVDSGGSMNALVLSLVTSDSFLYRK